ncbi:Protein enhanced disease resistance 2 [Vitis vinifera]|uniref:Protein enhanced disease resistance 2 n=1 Tax=Vitis vinifera TaxID=29760 RepID=A0A438HYV5_VITVI|nr:Protein enhanced disease resistance 2 [Vitis vinifera]
MAASKVMHEGWMVRCGRRKIGRSYIHMRYFVLESRLLAYYKRKPVQDAVPIKTLLIGGNCRVEDRGLKTHHGHALFALGIFGPSNCCKKKLGESDWTIGEVGLCTINYIYIDVKCLLELKEYPNCKRVRLMFNSPPQAGSLQVTLNSIFVTFNHRRSILCTVSINDDVIFISSKSLDYCKEKYNILRSQISVLPSGIIRKGVRTVLKGKDKLSHLIGIGLGLEDLKFNQWDEEDSMIMSWLWNSMLPKISGICMFLTMAKEIWETIRQTYSKGINHASGFKGGQQRSQAYVVDAINSGEEQSKYNNMELGELN